MANRKFKDKTEIQNRKMNNQPQNGWELINENRNREMQEMMRQGNSLADLQDAYGSQITSEPTYLTNPLFAGSKLADPSSWATNRNDGPPKAPPIMQNLPVSLRALRSGVSQKTRVVRSVKCSECHGRRTTQDIDVSCSDCSGKGYTEMANQAIQTSMTGFGAIPPRRLPCYPCGGVGFVIPQGEECTLCFGQGTVDEPFTLDVDLSSAKDGRIVVESQGNQSTDDGVNDGDIHFTLAIKPDQRFQDVAGRTYFRKKISPVQALVGCNFTIVHVDGSSVHFRCPHVISEQDVFYASDLETYVQFVYDMPTEPLDADQLLSLISTCLPLDDDKIAELAKLKEGPDFAFWNKRPHQPVNIQPFE